MTRKVCPVARRIDALLCEAAPAALLIAQPALAAPPDPAPSGLAPSGAIDDDLGQATPGFDASIPPPAFVQPGRDAPLDPVIAQLIVARLVQLHLLASPAEAQDPARAAEAIRGFQAGVGLKPTGVLDKVTIASFAL